MIFAKATNVNERQRTSAERQPNVSRTSAERQPNVGETTGLLLLSGN
jgi:hypothetical protein